MCHCWNDERIGLFFINKCLNKKQLDRQSSNYEHFFLYSIRGMMCSTGRKSRKVQENYFFYFLFSVSLSVAMVAPTSTYIQAVEL
jgi:hypothetical protein